IPEDLHDRVGKRLRPRLVPRPLDFLVGMIPQLERKPDPVFEAIDVGRRPDPRLPRLAILYLEYTLPKRRFFVSSLKLCFPFWVHYALSIHRVAEEGSGCRAGFLDRLCFLFAE